MSTNFDINNDSTIVNEIKKIISNNIVYRFQKELEDSYDEDKKSTIKKIIKKINNNKDEFDTKEVHKNKLNDFLDKMTENKFKQTWSRLNFDQKMTKIEEYLDSIEKDKITKKKLLLKIKKMMENNKLITSKEVDYDKETCKINSIKNFDNIRENI